MKTFLVVQTSDFEVPIADGNYMPERTFIYSDYGNAVDALNNILLENEKDPVEVKKLEHPHCIRLTNGYLELWICNTKEKCS